MGTLSMVANAGNHKGLPLHVYDRSNWYSIRLVRGTSHVLVTSDTIGHRSDWTS